MAHVEGEAHKEEGGEGEGAGSGEVRKGTATCALGLGAPGENEGANGEQGEGSEVDWIADHEIGGGDKLIFNALQLEAENRVHRYVGRACRRREGEQDARAAAARENMRCGRPHLRRPLRLGVHLRRSLRLGVHY